MNVGLFGFNIESVSDILVNRQHDLGDLYFSDLSIERCRKKFKKASTWNKLSVQDRAHLKAGCLNSLMSEPEKSVRLALEMQCVVKPAHENIYLAPE